MQLHRCRLGCHCWIIVIGKVASGLRCLTQAPWPMASGDVSPVYLRYVMHGKWDSSMPQLAVGIGFLVGSSQEPAASFENDEGILES